MSESEEESEPQKDYIKEAVKQALEAAWMTRARISSFEFVMRGALESRDYYSGQGSKSLREAIGVIHHALYQESAEAQTRLMQFAFMSQDPELLKEVAALIRDNYFRADNEVNHQIMQYLENEVRYTPSRYLVADHDNFSKQIQERFDRLIGKPTEEPNEDG